MVDHVMTSIPGPGNGGLPADGVPEIPLEPNEEDWRHLKWWHQVAWLSAKDNDPLDVDSPMISLFLEDALGNPISPGIKTALRNDLFAYWTDVYSSGEVPTKYTDTGLARKEDFRKTFEAKYPWLRLCEAHWKVNQLWVNYFRSWKGPRSSVTPEKSNPISKV
jgi:hypothetical protein